MNKAIDIKILLIEAKTTMAIVFKLKNDWCGEGSGIKATVRAEKPETKRDMPSLLRFEYVWPNIAIR